MIRVGIIGLGYWGPNLVRCFHELCDCRVEVVCDQSTERLAVAQSRFPYLSATRDADELLDARQIDAVVIATPTRTHYELATKALARGLHVFVEKPLATESQECRELCELAERVDRKLFVGHVFLHSAPMAKLRELVARDELGPLRYIGCTRLNLGPVRRDVSALWDLAPHDISIILDLLGEAPTSVSCTGLACLDPRIHDVCNVTLQFSGNRMALIHVSWLDPHKKRTVTVVGGKKMAVYDDLDAEKIKVYDKGVESPLGANSFGEFPFTYRYGDTYSPRLQETEPLKAECEDFIRSIVEDRAPRTDGWNGLAVVRVLEAAERSLRGRGELVEIEADDVALEEVTSDV